MPNPFAPLLGFLGVTAFGRRSKKRRRKSNQSDTNGTPTQRKSSRALDIIRIQRGLPRNEEPSPQTAGEDAVHQRTNGQVLPNRQVRPADVPPLRISKMLSSDTIGLTTDGKRGYVGAQWWARYGRSMLTQIRRRYPGATPDEALLLLSKQAAPSVDWDTAELPRGALMLSRRLRRLVEAAYMGREADAQVPQITRQRGPAQSPEEAPEGMPFIPPPAVGEQSGEDEEAPEADDAPEDGAEGSQEDVGEAEDAPKGRTRRGGRRGGKKDRKTAAAVPEQEEAAHDTSEDGGGSDSGGSTARPASNEAEPPSSQ